MKKLKTLMAVLSFSALLLCSLPAHSQNREDCAFIVGDALEHAGITIDTSLLSMGEARQEKKTTVVTIRYDDGTVSFDATVVSGKKSSSVEIAGTSADGEMDLSCSYDRSLRITELKDRRYPYRETWQYRSVSTFPASKSMVFDIRKDLAEYFPVMAEIFRIDSLFIRPGDAVVIEYDYDTQRPVSAVLTGKSKADALEQYGFCKATFDLGRYSEARRPFGSNIFDNDFNTSFDFLEGISPLINFIQFMDEDDNPVESPSGAGMVQFRQELWEDSLSNSVSFSNNMWKSVDVEFRGCRFSSIKESVWIDEGYENYSININAVADDAGVTAHGLSGYAVMASPSSVYAAAYGKDTKYVPITDFLSMGRFGLYWSTMRERNGNMVYQASFRGYDDDDRVVCYMGFSDMVIRYSGKSGVVKDVYYYGTDGEPALHAKYRCARISTRFSSAGKPLSLGLYDTGGELIRVIPYKEYAPEDYQFYNPELEP